MMDGTLVYLVRDNKVLLAHKKRGIGAGNWNGPGGKVEKGETPEQTMVRECQEEILVTPLTYYKAAQIQFKAYYEGEPLDYPVHAYICTDWEGTPTQTEEMEPRWFKFSEVPYDHMWEDDQHWLPDVLNGKILTGTCTFDEDNRLVEHSFQATEKQL